jgi:hypothetical protein
MALAHSGVTNKASSMQPTRLLRAHRQALELITSLRAAGADPACAKQAIYCAAIARFLRKVR